MLIDQSCAKINKYISIKYLYNENMNKKGIYSFYMELVSLLFFIFHFIK